MNSKNFFSHLENELYKRDQISLKRNLPEEKYAIDFCSNDYLGLSKNEQIKQKSKEILKKYKIKNSGSTGSRLISGNTILHKELENYLKQLYDKEAALLFNSGFGANLGVLSVIPKKEDIILFDQYIHASIREGIRLSNAKSYKFKHNDIADLEQKIQKFSDKKIYIVTESVFSMDGDSPDFKTLNHLLKKYKAALILDKAHSTKMPFCSPKIDNEIPMIEIHTFGKAIGSFGAVVLANQIVKDYLINFARSFIYTTALPPVVIANTMVAFLYDAGLENKKLEETIDYYLSKVNSIKEIISCSENKSPIQNIIFSGNDYCRKVAEKLQEKGLGIKAILSPTVPKGEERVRVCLHSYNTKEEIDLLFSEIKKIL